MKHGIFQRLVLLGLLSRRVGSFGRNNRLFTRVNPSIFSSPAVVTASASGCRRKVVLDDTLEAFIQVILPCPLCRFGSVLIFSHRHAQSKLFDGVDVDIHMQERLHPNYHWSFNLRMDGRKDINSISGAGNLKRGPKTVKLSPRPVSTQASSSRDSSVRHSAVDRNSMLSSGKHSLSIEVGHSLCRFIKGRGGSTQERIEREMGVKILFPSWREESITIEGSSVESITKASEKIQSIIDETVNSSSLDYSHFVSLPLAIHPELVGKLVKFQNNILGLEDNEILDPRRNEDKVVVQKDGKRSNVAVESKVDSNKNAEVNRAQIPLVNYLPKASTSSTLADLGIDKSIFINPRTFHLTVLMLKLWNKDRINTATEVLRNVSSKVMDALGNRPVFIRLEGLALMKGSPGQARVLYAPVKEVGNEGRLLRACKVITEAFVEAGLVLEKDANQTLKLHATLMNARHRRGKPGSVKMDWFDARGIFERYGSEEWGEYVIPEAHLSQRFVYDGNGYYHRCASIPFPRTSRVN